MTLNRVYGPYAIFGVTVGYSTWPPNLVVPLVLKVYCRVGMVGRVYSIA